LRDIANIVEKEIVDKMNNVLTVKQILGNIITTCGVKWACVNKVVQDSSGNDYDIVSVTHDTDTIEVRPLGAYVFTGTTLLLNTPHFFTGTPRATNTEWNEFSNDRRDKSPFIWLVEPTKEFDFPYSDTSIERDSKLRIAFIDTNDTDHWLTMAIHKNILQSLYNMRTEFLDTIKRGLLFEGVSNSSVQNLTRFGTQGRNGSEENIIGENLTGLDSRLTLSIYSIDGCKC
jgi:hypothetical protein